MANETRDIHFPPFRLDLRAQRVMRESEAISLRPKTWDLLLFLARRPGELVSKDELMDAVWGDVTVTVASLNQAVLELRRGLGDDARDPRYIETVHRKGFRFIARVTEPDTKDPSEDSGTGAVVTSVPDRISLVGRDGELERLRELAAEASAGRRQVVFLTGHPGIGKSSLLEAFLGGLDRDRVHVSGGRCIELVGESEAYLPVLEAVDRLARDEAGDVLRSSLRRFAPTWLAQMPWLIDDEVGAGSPLAGSPTRMLREFCVAMEEVAKDRPTVLWFEDLHWADESTVDLIGALARRVEPARLLVLATYRPVDAAMHDHPVAPLKRMLVRRGTAHAMTLELLGSADVREFVDEEFGSIDHAPELAEVLFNQTEGNPLFLKMMVRDLITKGWMALDDGRWEQVASIETLVRELPESMVEIVKARVESMAEGDVEVVEAASIIGETFSSDEVAMALGLDEETTEANCDRLARWGGFIRPVGEGSSAEGSEYEFLHQVFRRLLYRGIRPIRRRKLHLKLARGLENGGMKSESSGAAEIALHFELGGDPDRAIDYLVAAAEGVVRRFADREAISYLDHALVLLDSQPPSPDRDGRECDLRRRLATALVLTVGYTAPEQLANAERLIELGASSGDVEAELVGLSYKQDTHLASGDLDGAHRWAERTSRVATRATNPILKGHAFETLGHVLGLRGENVGSAASCERAFELLRDVPPREVSAVAAYDICVTASAFQGWAEWMLGLPEKASRLTKAGLERASMEGTTPVGIAMALSFALAVGYFRRDRDSVRNTGRELEACLEKYGVAWPYPLPAAAVGWLDLTEGRIAEGVERMRASGNAAREVGANHCISILYATIAEAELTRGCPAAGFEALDEAVHFVETDGERFWEAETHRLRGELLRLDGRDGEAEGWYDRSLEVARSQDALSLELRTSTSLARLWGDTERGDAARELLEGVLARFTEGFEEIDHREAKELLESL